MIRISIQNFKNDCANICPFLLIDALFFFSGSIFNTIHKGNYTPIMKEITFLAGLFWQSEDSNPVQVSVKLELYL